jgi:uncharacterized protein (UPF0297 family)
VCKRQYIGYLLHGCPTLIDRYANTNDRILMPGH